MFPRALRGTGTGYERGWTIDIVFLEKVLRAGPPPKHWDTCVHLEHVEQVLLALEEVGMPQDETTTPNPKVVPSRPVSEVRPSKERSLRERFEVWVRAQKYNADTERSPFSRRTVYSNPSIELAWQAVQSTNSPVETTAPIPKVVPRRPYDDDMPEGYLESDRDYVENNMDAAVILLDRVVTARQEDPNDIPICKDRGGDRYEGSLDTFSENAAASQRIDVKELSDCIERGPSF
jgi:hypothetical protein